MLSMLGSHILFFLPAGGVVRAAPPPPVTIWVHVVCWDPELYGPFPLLPLSRVVFSCSSIECKSMIRAWLGLHT